MKQLKSNAVLDVETPIIQEKNVGKFSLKLSGNGKFSGTSLPKRQLNNLHVNGLNANFNRKFLPKVYMDY